MSERLTVEEVYASVSESAEDVEVMIRAEGEQLGYSIAFVFTSPALVDGTHPLFTPLVNAARVRAVHLGIDVVSIAPSRENWLEAESLERCQRTGVEGLIVFGGSDGNPDVLRERWPDAAAAFVEYDTLGTRSAHISMDNISAFGEVVLHLAEAGHSRIATITGIVDSRPAAERLSGYRDVVRRLGLVAPREYIELGDWSPSGAYEAAKRLLALDPRPDAIACACDVQAVGAMRAIIEQGLSVPGDIAVTGFDDADFAALVTPSLTTVRQPAEAMGAAAVDAVVSMLKNPSMAPPVVVEPGELVIRESSGAFAPAH